MKLKGLKNVANDADRLEEGMYLMLWVYDEEKPPHLMLLVSGVYLSLEAKGSTVDGSVKALNRSVKRRKVRTIYIELNIESRSPLLWAQQIFRESAGLEVEGTTCLSPIRSFLSQFYRQNFSTARFIYELLPMLQSADCVGDMWQMNLSESTVNYTLSTYNLDQVRTSINQAMVSA